MSLGGEGLLETKLVIDRFAQSRADAHDLKDQGSSDNFMPALARWLKPSFLDMTCRKLNQKNNMKASGQQQLGFNFVGDR